MKTRAVIVNQKMAQLMEHHLLNAGQGHMNESLIHGDNTLQKQARAPARFHGAHAQRRQGHAIGPYKLILLQQNPLKTDPDPVRHNRHAVNGVIVEDIDSCMIKFAKCCTPVPGDAIVGFITKGFGVSVHRADCPNAQNRDEPHQAARWVRVRWATQEEQPFETTLELDCITRDGLVLDVATVMSTARVRVKELNAKDLPGNRSTIIIRFEVKNVAELDSIRKKLLNIRDVTSSRRGQN